MDKYIGGISNYASYGFPLCDVPHKMQENSRSGLPPNDVERFMFVVQGSATLSNASGAHHQMTLDSYTYLPPNFEHSLGCGASATLAVFERRYDSLENHFTEQIVGSTDQQPLLETPGEVFELRKLLPPSLPYDFNIHIMDFQPGEFLNVKEVHYNPHGLLLLEGQGIQFNLVMPFGWPVLCPNGTLHLYKDVNRNHCNQTPQKLSPGFIELILAGIDQFLKQRSSF
ncbi:PREDICTED: (S)-ureidoglycine aminohydrolase-like isoform X1 [Populus euphratica]|uniref:(S)-ureidoglycine aminohydrolase-like isoform X1 n=1 Tax=Populus euphratica TaxID=75702 RepID=A0AAJ6YA07_POPEU|nr:PREDICTED: (S)-ureidoglycine aminohydrolase-like isoform X1 [Populus euphratica]